MTKIADRQIGSITIRKNITAGEDVLAGDVLYLKSDGKFYKAISTDSTKSAAIAIANEAILMNAIGEVVTFGAVTNVSWSFTVGAKVYLSSTSGGASMAQSGYILGTAIDTTSILFHPIENYNNTSIINALIFG